jgi:hypothetical protein
MKSTNPTRSQRLAKLASIRRKMTAIPVKRPKARTAKAIATYAIGSFALGALATGAMYVGTFAIGRLAIRKGRIHQLRIDELEIGKYVVAEGEKVSEENGHVLPEKVPAVEV